MMDDTATALDTIPAFPAKEIEACIRECLAGEGETQAVLGAFTAGAEGSNKPQLIIDSLVVVFTLCAVELKVPFKLPRNLVRPEEFKNEDEMIQHFMPKLQKLWHKHHEENR